MIHRSIYGINPNTATSGVQQTQISDTAIQKYFLKNYEQQTAQSCPNLRQLNSNQYFSWYLRYYNSNVSMVISLQNTRIADRSSEFVYQI